MQGMSPVNRKCIYPTTTTTTTTTTTATTTTAAITTATCHYSGADLSNPDLSEVAQYCSIDASLQYATSSITSLTLNTLTWISGTLNLAGNLDLASVELAELAFIGGSVTVDGADDSSACQLSASCTANALSYVSFPSLAAIVGSFEVIESDGTNTNALLTSIDIPVLSYVGGHFLLYADSALTSFAASALTYIGDYLHIVQLSALQAFSLPALATVVGVTTGTDSIMFCYNSIDAPQSFLTPFSSQSCHHGVSCEIASCAP